MAWWTRARAWWRAHPVVGDVAVAVVILLVGLAGQPNPQTGEAVPLTPGVVALLVAACATLVARRRLPLTVWVVTTSLAAWSVALVAGPAPVIVVPMVAVYTVATRRPVRAALVVTVLTPVALIGTYHAVAPASALLGDAAYTVTAVSVMACAVGFAVRGQRQIVADAEERARVAEQTREEEAQRRVTQERLRIARELHDVVAHHIAVINVQSGVARHLLESDPAAAAEALGHVREASGVVLSEMSTILGLLRTPDDTSDTQPAPGLAQVEVLVDSVRRSGTAVTVRTTGTPRDLAPGTDLAAYRIVQESLTNAGKHGAGSAEVTVEYRPDSIVIDVANPLAASRGAQAEGAGHGLVGMRERVSALGGQLDAGEYPDGRFVVHVELPAGVSA